MKNFSEYLTIKSQILYIFGDLMNKNWVKAYFY